MAATFFALENMSKAYTRLINYQNLQQSSNSTSSLEPSIQDVETTDCLPDDDHVSPDDAGTNWFRADIIGISLSLVSLSFVSYAILSDKRIRGHPNNIIAYICLCDAYTYCQYFNRYLICGYDLNQYLEVLFSWTFMEPYYYITINWLGVKHTANNGVPIDWENL